MPAAGAGAPPSVRRSELARVLALDAGHGTYRWVYRPMLVLQFLLYLRGLSLFIADPAFEQVGGARDPVLHENHIGNLTHMASQPNVVLLGIHLGMAVFWIGGLLVQKHLVARMAGAVAGSATRDPAAYKRYRRAHALLGTAMCSVALAGCIAGPTIAYQSHGHPAMRTFLLLLPAFFIPSILQAWFTARAHRHGDHRFWANLAFLAPAVASLWAEALIYACGRHTHLGTRLGELVGVGIAYVMALALIALPLMRARRAVQSGT